MLKECYEDEVPRFFAAFEEEFLAEHESDLRELKPMSLHEHLKQNKIAQLYLSNKYRLSLSAVAFFNLVQFLENNEKQGGSVIMGIIQEHLHIVTVDRVAPDQNSLAKLLVRANAEEDHPAEDEGIPGHNPGSANTDNTARSAVLTRLKLGPMAREQELLDDVRGELAEDDTLSPPPPGKPTYLQHFETMIKREEGEDFPTAADVPYPPSTARDVALEVHKVKENRDRFKIEGRTGGVGAGVSVSMYTVHNSHGKQVTHVTLFRAVTTKLTVSLASSPWTFPPTISLLLLALTSPLSESGP